MSDSVGLIHNIPSPYRLPIFESLSTKTDLTVYFCTTEHEDRYWESNLTDYSFDYAFLDSYRIGLFYISFKIFFHILSSNHEKIVISENPPTLFISIISILAGKISGADIIIWNEAGDEAVMPASSDLSNYQKVKKLVLIYSIRLYRRALYRSADGFIAFSEMAENYLKERGVDETQITTCRQVMPKERLPEVIESGDVSSKFSEDKTSILYFGYIRPWKGVEFLLQTYTELPKEDKQDIELIIAGGGDENYMNKVRDIAENLPNVRVVGYVDHKYKGSYYDHADIFILPTFRDPWGLVINESLYYGTPVITTNAAGGKEIVDRNGLIIPTGDKQSLKNALALSISGQFIKSISPKNDMKENISDPEIMANGLLTAIH